MAGGALFGEVAVVAGLVDVERHQIHCRIMVGAVPAVAIEEAIDDVLGVGILEVGGGDGGDFWTVLRHERLRGHYMAVRIKTGAGGRGRIGGWGLARLAGMGAGGAFGASGASRSRLRRGAAGAGADRASEEAARGVARVRWAHSCGGSRVLSRRGHRGAEVGRAVRSVAGEGGRARGVFLFGVRDGGLLSGAAGD